MKAHKLNFALMSCIQKNNSFLQSNCFLTNIKSTCATHKSKVRAVEKSLVSFFKSFLTAEN